MKTKRLLLSLVTMLVTAVSWADVAINETNFPDALFRNYLTSQSYGSDGIITDAEIQDITYLYIDGKSISSLQGLEYFTALKYLSCYNNQLTSLDVSNCTALQSLYCHDNKLTSLNITGCTALTYLSCQNNQLTSLNVQNCTALQSLSCSQNQLTSLNVSGCTKLTYLSCENNQLASLDVSSCTALQSLYCQNNKLTSLDLSKNTNLSNVNLSGNPLAGNIEGSCGTNARYSLNLSSGALSITGTGAIDWENSTDNSSAYMEAYSDYVKTINIANGITKIGRRAFRHCENLTSVSIPNSVTSIGESAFGHCDALTSFTLPNSVTEVGDWIFEDIDNFPVTVYNNSCFVIMQSSYKGAYTIPAGIKTICGGAFYGCAGLTSVTIPNSVTTIGEEAFAKSGLKSVTIPNSVTTIGDEAFEKCPYLETVVFPSNVTNIGEGIFKDCSSLKSPIYTSSTFIFMPTLYSGAYTIPAGIKTIIPSAFNKCKGLTSVIIPDGVTSIGENTFYQCTALTSVNIPNGVTSIGDYAFYNCSALTVVNIPEGVTTLGSSAFSGCSGLKSISIPSTVKSFGSYSTFYGCRGELTIACNIPSASVSYNTVFAGSKFSSVNITNGVTSIGDYAFYLSDSLKTITIPSSVNYIGTQAFDGYRNNIKDIYNYASTPQSIDNHTFTEYSASTTLHVKHGYKDIYKNAYYWKIFTIVDDLYDNVIYAKETAVQNATFTIPVVAKHTMKVSGFSFNFKCPDGFTVKKIARGTATKERDDSDEYYFNTFKSSLKDGMYYVLCTTTQDYFLPESEEDEIAVITLEASIDTKNGNYPLAIIDGELAYDKENARVDYYEKPLHFEFLPGDANGDGRISIADVTAIASYLLGNEPEVFYKNAAAIANGYDDVDEEGDPRLSVGDITAIVNILLKKN